MKYLTLFCVIGFFCSSAMAQTTNIWTNDVGDYSWQTAGNWSLGHVPVSTENVVVYTVDPEVIWVSEDINIQNLYITNGYVALGESHLVCTFTGGVNVEVGNHGIDGIGYLDIGNATLLISGTGGPANGTAYYQGLVISSDAGTEEWDTVGIGITSSLMVAANNARPNSYGIAVVNGDDGVVSGLPAGTVEITTAVLGDCNLDGVVNFTDYSIVAANYGQVRTDWDNGSFDYDGIVDFGDYSLLTGNYGMKYGL